MSFCSACSLPVLRRVQMGLHCCRLCASRHNTLHRPYLGQVLRDNSNDQSFEDALCRSAAALRKCNAMNAGDSSRGALLQHRRTFQLSIRGGSWHGHDVLQCMACGKVKEHASISNNLLCLGSLDYLYDHLVGESTSVSVERQRTTMSQRTRILS